MYMIPKIIGLDVQEYDIWHGSNFSDSDYVEDIPAELIENIKESEKQWMADLYNSDQFRNIRNRYIEIYHELKNTKDREKRKDLLKESRILLNSLKYN